MKVADNIKSVLQTIENAAKKAGRNPEKITLVAVTKTVSAQVAQEVLDCGIINIGENRVQSFLDKYEVLGQKPAWHIIGHLQTNKVKYIVGKVDLIHSVDSVHLAEAIHKKAVEEGVCQDILLQFNISGEATKSGESPDNALEFCRKVSCLSGVRVKGLMTMAPLGASSQERRLVFRGLKTLFEDIKKQNFPGFSMEHLSMGMSGDYEDAILEGATLIRVGTALFR